MGTRTTSSHDSESAFNDEPQEMWFKMMNPYAPVTVVMVHLLFSSHLEWAHVWPKLTEYHLLIPDLPQHSRSRAIKPFNFALACDLLADMVRKHAHNGQAHFVGISTGGFIAQEMARRHPDVVLSVFASGCCPLKGARILTSQYPRLLHYGLVALLNSPNQWFLKISRWCPELQNSALLGEVKANADKRLSQNGTRDTGAFQDAAVEEIAKMGIRIAMIAAGQQDDVAEHFATAAKYRELNHGEGQRSCAWVVRDAVHAWNMQYPELFARGIKAWIEGWIMPAEFEAAE